jgi:hypothetical protein
MKFALFNDERIEATKGAKGVCPCCGSELIAKCGEVYIHHWAHKNKCDDHWWENETEWHRNWKNEFPSHWQEVVHHDKSGEKHIADVKTDEDWTIEFQHSYLKPEERRSRNNFYNKLIWIVDGTRRPTDIQQFKKAISEDCRLDKPSQKLLHVFLPELSRLLMEWQGSDSIVFLDFKDELSNDKGLWLIYPRMYKDNIFLSQLSRSAFIEYLNNNKFDEIMDKAIKPIKETVEHSIKKNDRRNRALQLTNKFFFVNYSALPKSYLGHLKLPYGVLKKIQ